MAGRTKSNSATVSLFPFLSVLICTMGSLILLLLITTRQIQERVIRQHLDAEAHQPAPPPSIPEPPPVIVTPSRESLEAEWNQKIAQAQSDRDQHQARLKQALKSEQKSQAQLQSVQSALKALQIQVAKLREEKKSNLKQQAALTDEQRELAKDLEQAREQIRQRKAKLAEARSQFAMIPFDGQSGTTRRPIFMECSERGIRILPEDILLSPSDLTGFTDRYNPLLAGTDVLINYWTTRDQQQSKPGETPQPPYILLIVRPSGTVAYYLARRYLSRLRHPFGYELVEEDYPLYFPTPDPHAKVLLEKEIAQTFRTRSSVLAERSRGTDPAEDLIIINSLNNEEHTREELEKRKPIDPTLPLPAHPKTENPLAINNARGGNHPASMPGTSAPPGMSNESGSDESGETGGGSPPPLSGTMVSNQRLRTGTSTSPLTGSNPQSGALSAGSPGGNGETFAPIGLGPEQDSDESHEPLTGKSSTGQAPVGSSPDPAAGMIPAVPESPFAPQASQKRRSMAGSSSPSSEETTDELTSPTPQRKPSSNTSANTSNSKSSTTKPPPKSSSTSGNPPPPPNESVVFGGPAAAAGGSTDSTRNQHFSRQRWGRAATRASIGLEKGVPIKIFPDRFVVGDDGDIVIPIEEGTTRRELAEQLLGSIDQVASDWGNPPDGFYWIPAAKCQIQPGANLNYPRLAGVLSQFGIAATPEFVRPSQGRKE